jgi:hypothetical protein
MTTRIRPSGPRGVTRPYNSMLGTTEPAHQIAQALDHIAVALSAIDHNLEVLVNHLKKPQR